MRELRVKKLQYELQKRGLAKTGSKAVLAKRLENALQLNNEDTVDQMDQKTKVETTGVETAKPYAQRQHDIAPMIINMEKQIIECIKSFHAQHNDIDTTAKEQLITKLKQENEKLKENMRRNKTEYQLRERK